MPSVRTQIYLTAEQRNRLEERGRREGRSIAALVRDALDAYLLADAAVDREAVLRSTFGVLPTLHVPSRDEWGHG